MRKLPAEEIAVGHCVILNDAEQPCGRLVAVITAIEGDVAWCKYLNRNQAMNEFNHGRGMKIERDSSIHNLTPVGKFSVDVWLDAKGRYWCEQFQPSEATYRDGKPRAWQGNNGVMYYARQDVLEGIK